MALQGESHTTGGGSSGDRLGLFLPAASALLPTLLLAAVLVAVPVLGQPAVSDPPPPPPRSSENIFHIQGDARDSLVVEIHRYSQMISNMRDSLSLAELGLGVELGPEEKKSLENSIQHFTRLIEEIGAQLGDMNLEIADNQITFLDAQGEGIIINIPENIDEQLSQGLNVLSKMILSELPDSLSIGQGNSLGWKGIALKPFGQKEKRKVIKGNIVKVWDRLQVSENEDVRGHVVVVFGDAQVSGRVDGNVVAVFGDLFLTDEAEITGQVVAIGGRLDQDPGAEVADVVVVDPWRSLGTDGPEGILNPGPMNFLLGQGEFLAMVLFSVLAYSLAPRRRLENSLARLQESPIPSLGAGLLASFGLHLVTLVVIAILVLTVIGIPVALLVGLALVALGILSVGLVALALGRLLCRRFSGNCGSTWLAVILGLVLLHLVSFLGQLVGIFSGLSGLSQILMALGFAIKFGAYFFGLGALVLTRFGATEARQSSSADMPDSPSV